jgi:DNA polymerase/3'-5' exonuclease PolX
MESAIITLKEFAQIYDDIGDNFRAAAYRNALRQLERSEKRQSITLESGSMPAIGKSIREVITDVINNGSSAKLRELKMSPKYVAMAQFLKIKYVGRETALEFINAGIYTLADLRRAVGDGRITLTRAQQYGLKYYVDLQQPIPRSEVAKIGMRMLMHAHSVCLPNPHVNAQLEQLTFTLVGSYRRGARESGDVDILISVYYDEFMNKFESAIAADPHYIATIRKGTQMMQILFMGGDKHYSYVRSIDILKVPRCELAPSLLYFTGSGIFNEEMRRHAKSMGYKLNQHGLYKQVFMTKTTKTTKPKKQLRYLAIKVTSEEDIFKELQLPYRNVTDRERF